MPPPPRRLPRLAILLDFPLVAALWATNLGLGWFNLEARRRCPVWGVIEAFLFSDDMSFSLLVASRSPVSYALRRRTSGSMLGSETLDSTEFGPRRMPWRN